MTSNIQQFKPLQKPQVYIYILINESGLIKIGKTSNIKQRIQSLSGSNGRGDQIVDAYCSGPTYLYTLEKIMHSIYKENRIIGTEWFKDLDYDVVCNQLNLLIESDSYKKCNEIRKKFIEGNN